MNRSLSVVLRHHAPPVEHPEGPAAARLYAWTIESALPLLAALRDLRRRGVRARFTAVITPLVAEMWAHPALRAGLDAALSDRLRALAETTRAADRDARASARARLARLEAIADLWRAIDGDPNAAWAELAADGRVELATAPATDAVLPLIGERGFARPQIAVAVATHRARFGAPPAGIDLTRGYSPRLDLLCAEYGLRWCLVPPAAFARATAPPVYGPLAPLHCPNSGVAAFCADPVTLGLPTGGAAHADAQLDRGLVEPATSLHLAVHPEALGAPPATRRLAAAPFAAPYDPEAAEAAAAKLAGAWVEARIAEAAADAGRLDRAPHRVAAFDAALLGRWWAAGPAFVGAVAEAAAHSAAPELLTTPGEWMSDHPVNQSAWPGPARDGAAPGFAAAGDDPDREWLLRALPAAAERLTRVADRFVGAVPEAQAPARRAARALLLAQCGDWPLMIEDGRAGAEAVAALRAHLAAFEAAVSASAGEAAPPQPPEPVRLFADVELAPFASW